VAVNAGALHLDQIPQSVLQVSCNLTLGHHLVLPVPRERRDKLLPTDAHQHLTFAEPDLTIGLGKQQESVVVDGVPCEHTSKVPDLLLDVLIRQHSAGWHRHDQPVPAVSFGSRLGPFGRTEERRMERALIHEYRDLIEQEVAQLNEENLDRALAVARVPESIRGYGHVKSASVASARGKWVALTATMPLESAVASA